jgi:hypothetical protein
MHNVYVTVFTFQQQFLWRDAPSQTCFRFLPCRNPQTGLNILMKLNRFSSVFLERSFVALEVLLFISKDRPWHTGTGTLYKILFYHFFVTKTYIWIRIHQKPGSESGFNKSLDPNPDSPKVRIRIHQKPGSGFTKSLDLDPYSMT